MIEQLAGLSQLQDLSVSSTDIGDVVSKLSALRPPLRVLRLPHCLLKDSYGDLTEWPARRSILEALYDRLEVSCSQLLCATCMATSLICWPG